LGEIRKGVKTAKNMTFFVAEIMKHNATGRQALKPRQKRRKIIFLSNMSIQNY
jgi:hypothetical protein